MYKVIGNMGICRTGVVVICFTLLAQSLNGQLASGSQADDKDVQTIIRRLKYLEARDQEHARENELLRHQLKSYSEELKLLNDKNNDLTERIGVTEASNGDLRKRLHDVEISLVKGRFETTHEHEAAPSKIIDNVEPRAKRMENEGTIAFYATLNASMEHIGTNQNIVFEHVVTNLGNGYNVHVGDFRAPVGGTYVFSVTLTTFGTHSNHYRIRKNSLTFGHVYNRGAESPFASASLTAVVQLQKGDTVSIGNVEPDEALYGMSFTAFSGFLLQQDYTYPAIVG